MSGESPDAFLKKLIGEEAHVRIEEIVRARNLIDSIAKALSLSAGRLSEFGPILQEAILHLPLQAVDDSGKRDEIRNAMIKAVEGVASDLGLDAIYQSLFVAEFSRCIRDPEAKPFEKRV